MRNDPPPRLLSAWDLLAATGYLALAMLYSRVVRLLPDPVPTHFNALGHPNGWTAKADLPWVIFGLSVLPWGVMMIIGVAASLAGPRADGKPPVSLQPLRGLLGFGMAILMGGCLLMPLGGTPWVLAGVVAFFLCLATGIALLARDGARSLSALPQTLPYRWGVFYVNPQDPRLWVEKRLGTGWTLNYARPAAFWITALLLVPVFLAVGAIFYRGR